MSKATKLIFCLMLLLLAACKPETRELTSNPETIFRDNVSPGTLSLLGIMLGDSEANIPEDQIVTRVAGRTYCYGDVSFFIERGTVTGFVLGSTFLDRLNLNSEQKVAGKLGSADETSRSIIATGMTGDFASAKSQLFLFRSKGVIVHWIEFADHKYGSVIVSDDIENIHEKLEAIDREYELFLTHLNSGMAFYELGDYENAATSLEQAIEIQPDLPGAHIGLGKSYLALGKYEQAETVFKQVIALWSLSQPSRSFLDSMLSESEYSNQTMVAEAHYGLALVYAAQGDADAARIQLQEANQLDPNHRLDSMLDTSSHSLGKPKQLDMDSRIEIYLALTTARIAADICIHNERSYCPEDGDIWAINLISEEYDVAKDKLLDIVHEGQGASWQRYLGVSSLMLVTYIPDREGRMPTIAEIRAIVGSSQETTEVLAQTMAERYPGVDFDKAFTTLARRSTSLNLSEVENVLDAYVLLLSDCYAQKGSSDPLWCMEYLDAAHQSFAIIFEGHIPDVRMLLETYAQTADAETAAAAATILSIPIQSSDGRSVFYGDNGSAQLLMEAQNRFDDFVFQMALRTSIDILSSQN